MSFTDTSLCFNSSTTSCVVHSVVTSSNIQQACNAKIANIPVIKNVTQRSSPNA